MEGGDNFCFPASGVFFFFFAIDLLAGRRDLVLVRRMCPCLEEEEAPRSLGLW